MLQSVRFPHHTFSVLLTSNMSKSEQKSIAFENAAELSEWLMNHHQRSSEVWVQIFKKGFGKPSVT